MSEDTDRIRKEILIRAPRERVWRALTDGGEFGSWFGARIDQKAFAPGVRVTGTITSRGYEHVTLDIAVERVEEGRLLAWRWHPYAVEAGRDYSAEPTTLVVFELRDAPEGTLLTVEESGFDALPPSRRAEARRMNDGGWAAQVRNVERHVAGAR